MGVDLDIWQNIADFDFDEAAQPGYFVGKLAHDNGWRGEYAERVLGEYRRYVYLACTADHVVVPSDQVDMAWHQHLLDTEQYWGVFCASVLNRPLHHRPNKGGLAGQAIHQALYDRTLRTYAETFDCVPPDDIWPPPARRFGSSGHRRTVVDPKWLLRTRRVHAMGVALAIATVVPVVVAWTGSADATSTAFEGSTFGWTDGEFFPGYAVAIVLAIATALRVRRRFFGPWQAPGSGAGVTLDPYDAAVLATNGRRAVNVAVAALVRDDALAFDKRALTTEKAKYRLARTGPLPPRPHPLERAAYDAVAQTGDGALLSDVHRRSAPGVDRFLDTLRQRQLLGWPEHRGRRRFLVALPILVVVFVGFVWAVGARTQWAPMSFFVGLLLLIFALGISSPPQATALGTDAVNSTRAKREPMSQVEREDVADGRALAWVVALQGATVLDGAALSVLREAITAPESKGGGGEVPSSSGGGGWGGGCGCGG
jgi:uncharacterized protein (TIGR04222 family)